MMERMKVKDAKQDFEDSEWVATKFLLFCFSEFRGFKIITKCILKFYMLI